MIGEILVRVGVDINELSRGLRDGASQLQNFGNSMSSAGSQIAGTFGVASGAIVGGLGAAVKTAADFDTAMRKAGAVAGASADELDAMRQSALELGASTSQSASSVATAMQEMAAKGYNATEIIASMPGVISAAEASGEDLALAADTVSSALNIFGLEASESTRVADILAETANSTAAGIGDMAYALKYAGAPANALGISLEETAAAIGLMTNAGIDGSSAGTALRASLLALNNPANEQSKIMDSLGVSLYDNAGKMKSISGIVAELTDKTKGMTEAQKTATIAKLVGTEAVSGFLALMEAGPATIDSMTASLENSAGASAKTAAEMKAGIGGAMEEMSGAIETLAITIGDQLVPYIQQAAVFISNLVNSFNNASPAIQSFVTFAAVLAGALLGLVAVGGTLAFIIGNVISAFSAVATVITTVVTAFSAGGAAATLLGTIFTALTGPIGLTIAAIAALIAIFVTAYNKCDWFREMVNEAWSAIKSAAVAAFGAVKDAILKAIDGIVSFGKQQLKVFSDLWKDHGTQISSIVKGFLQVISVAFTASFGLFKTIVSTTWTAISGATQTAWTLIKGTISTFTTLITGIIRTAMAILNGDWSGAWNTIKSTVSSIASTIVSTIKGIDLLSIGKDVVNGLVKGISSMFGSVKKKISELASMIPDWAKKVLGIKSPSRILRDEVGKWIPAGLSVGITRNMGEVQSATEQMAAASIPDLARADFAKLGEEIGEGFADGLEGMERDVEKAAAILAQAAQPNVNPTAFGGYTAGTTSKIETQLQSQFKAEADRKKGDFVLQVDGYELARVQKDYIGGMMKRETSLRTAVRGL